MYEAAIPEQYQLAPGRKCSANPKLCGSSSCDSAEAELIARELVLKRLPRQLKNLRMILILFAGTGEGERYSGIQK